MTTRGEEAIETFMSIAGVPEATAIVKLQEHGGNLNQAINAHFTGEDGTRIREPAIVASVDDAMEVDDDFHTEVHRPPFSHLPSSGILNPLSLLDPNFTRRFISGEIDLTSREPLVSHPIEAREVQGNLNPFSLLDPSFTRRFLSGEIDISSSEPLVSHPIERAGQSGSAPAIEEVTGNVHSHGPEVEGIVTTIDDDEEAPDMRLRSGIVDVPDYSNDIEEEMIRVAIEASKNDAEIDEPLDNQSISIHDEVEILEDQPLVRQRRRRTSPREDDQLGRDIHSDEWGGISSVEHDEAVMLEAAMFGGVPEGSTYRTPFASHQFMHNGSDSSLGPYSRPAPRPPSPSLTAQRLIREQQDDEYLASLQADREKELKAKEEEEAALAEERIKEDELRRKIEDDQEIERQLAAKEASLPEEPALDDENAVTLLIRMPDGSKRGRRFLKSDKLQRLFDFIDVGRVIKPGTYRVVIPYPRRAFSDGESSLTLNELGLTSKHEALFLELI